jgi:serine/threonine-protein kinase RsbW
MDVTFRYLGSDEGTVLTGAIEAAYGQSYDVRWVYDPEEVGRRIASGTYVSCVAESPAGELLCHMGMSLAAAGDAVAHSGQAVTLPAARGRHLFTRTKQWLMERARERGLAGMYSEATAAHPYSQKANVDLGAHETGFLLGWIPATVSNDAATGRRGRQSAALFYAKLNDGHERQVYAPERHRRSSPRRSSSASCGGSWPIHRRTASWRSAASSRSRSTRTTTWRGSPSTRRARTWRRRSAPSVTTSSTTPSSTRST